MNPVGGYILETNTTVKFTTDEVYHSKFFNPLFGVDGSLYGQSPLKAAAETVSKQNQAELTELKQFENQSPPYLLYRDSSDMIGNLTPEQREEIADLFNDYNKKKKTGKPFVLPEKFGFLKLGVSPVDLGILESTQEGRRILCNIYGIPSQLMGDVAGSTYNNIIEAKRDAWNNCIIPNLNDFANDLTSFLISPVPEYVSQGYFFGYDYSAVSELQKDYDTMVRWMLSAKWTPNEIREATGAKPIDNQLMNEPWFGMSETPLSAMSGTEETLLKNIGDYR
jgi:HK97 family phage portal protein